MAIALKLLSDNASTHVIRACIGIKGMSTGLEQHDY
jgi:hypothetical protein